MTMYNVHDAKTHFSELLERVHKGEEIIVAKAGKPYARLVPLEQRAKRVPGRYPDKTPPSFFEALPEDELAQWES